ncbi:hypothetical protein FRB99_008122 [Tulasnella sp. 403]|nr:hypothetical protein FRB99_008122 [Tulasnella sp. 403]
MAILSSLEFKILAATSLVLYYIGRRWRIRKVSDLHRMKQALALTDPAAITYIFSKHPYEYLKSQVIRPLIDRLLGKSLVWAEGLQHKRQRAMLAPVFTHEAVRRMDEEVHTAAEKLVNLMQEYIHSHTPSAKDPANGHANGGTKPTSAGVRLNILEWNCRATLDIIGTVGFGHDFQCGESPEARAIQASWAKLVSMGLDFSGFVAPLVVRAFPFIAHLPIPSIQAQGEIKVLIKKLARKIVEDRNTLSAVDKDLAASKGKVGKDLLSIIMSMRETQGEDLDQLLDHICTFVLVGHETTSATLNYTLMELARNKDVQDKLRQEILDFQGSGPGGQPTYDEFQSKLPYLDAVAKESLRVYPPASHTERVAQRDDVLPLRFPITTPEGEELTSIRIKKGQARLIINVSTIAINRNTAVWGPDAEIFRPDRWLDPDQLPLPTTLSQGWSGVFTFTEGPRICIGYRLALHEYKVILSALIRHFEFSDAGEKIVTQFSSTMQPYVEDKKAEGVQIPLLVKELHF